MLFYVEERLFLTMIFMIAYKQRGYFQGSLQNNKRSVEYTLNWTLCRINHSMARIINGYSFFHAANWENSVAAVCLKSL